jgi:predicted outer membrane repeat protein
VRATRPRPIRSARARRTVAPLLALVAATLGVVATAAPSSALTVLTVTTNADDGPGSLRAALLATIFGGDDFTIVIPPEVGDITLTTGELFADTDAFDLTIVGSGQTIEQTTPGARVLHVIAHHSVLIQDLTFTGGDTTSIGGGIFQDSDGQVTLERVTVTGNRAGGGAGVAVDDGGAVLIDSAVTDNEAVGDSPNWGGGMFVVGGLTVIDSEISGNVIDGDGGGVHVWGDVFVQRSTIDANEARPGGFGSEGHGGGIFTVDYGPYGAGDVVIEDSTVSGNTSSLDGGGIHAVGAVTVTGSTLSGNSATGRGGGVLAPSAVVTNSTLSANTAGRQGGAVAVTDGSADLRFTTVVAGSALEGAGIHGDASLHATVLASAASGEHCAGGTASSTGANLADDTSCGLTAAGDQQAPGLDPMLGPLADYGGPTLTHLPATGSPLIDGVPVAACGLAAGVDQRGLVRPSGAACDIGAVEVQQAPPDPVTPPPPAPPTPVTAEPRFTG